jgi:hypothetical protein
MKRLLTLCIFINYSLFTYSQAPNWQINENYMYTSFIDDFNDPNLPQWRPGSILREIGQLIDSSLTHRVQNGQLELTMAHIQGYNASADYVGQEFITTKIFRLAYLNARLHLPKDLDPGQPFGRFSVFA